MTPPAIGWGTVHASAMLRRRFLAVTLGCAAVPRIAFARQPQAREPLREWDGKPNYKKFKKVCDVWVFFAGLVLMRFFFVETDEPGARCEGGGVCLRRKRLWHGLWCEQAFFHCGIVEANSCFSVLERRVTRTFADAECDLQ